jgi:hypothetical protein
VVTFELSPERDLSYVGVDLRSTLEDGLFLLALGPEPDCRRELEGKDPPSGLCTPLELRLEDPAEFQPVCRDACKIWADVMPKRCGRKQHWLGNSERRLRAANGELQSQAQFTSADGGMT